MGKRYEALGTVSVPTGDIGNHLLLDAGDVVDESELPEWFVKKLDSDEYTSSLFREAGKDAQSPARAAAHDPGVEAMKTVEELTRQRATLPPEERGFVDAGQEQVPTRLDPGRTLPESGADTPAADKWAQGTADTSEAGKDRLVQHQERQEAVQAAQEAANERRSSRVQAQAERRKPGPKPGQKAKQAQQQQKKAQQHDAGGPKETSDVGAGGNAPAEGGDTPPPAE